MKLHVPEYYTEFKCIANKCTDTCCKDWEIDIDVKTNEFYKNVHGDLGKKLKNNISSENSTHFILNKQKKCPFLNKNNLCDIFIKLGEDHLCKICALHPRYFEWFENLKEGGIGLCCEEAARIILSQDKNFKISEIETEYESCEIYDKNLYSYLYDIRNNIIKYLDDSSISLDMRICNILKNAWAIQEEIDTKDLLEPYKFLTFENVSIKKDFKSLLNFFLKLEFLKPSWNQKLKSYITKHTEFTNKITDFEIANPKIDLYLKNIAIYFIWRYFLKGVFDKDIWSKVNLMFVSIIVIKYMFFCSWLENGYLKFEDCISITKDYSKEIEYNSDNLALLADAAYNNYFFSVQNLIAVFT